MRKDVLTGMMVLGILLIGCQGVSAETEEEYFIGKSLEIKVYFVRIGRAEQELVSTQLTIPHTLGVARAAILKLLEGPSPHERQRLGLDTAIPEGTRLNRIWIEKGIIYVDFSREILNYGGGSMNVLCILGQVEETLKQFPSVKKVVILIEGQKEILQQREMLQP